MFGRLEKHDTVGDCSICGLQGEVEVMILDGNVEGSICKDEEVCQEAQSYSLWDNYTYKG